MCSVHFEGGRKIGKKDIPCLFAWTKKPSRPPPKKRALLEKTNITCQESSLTEEDIEELTEDMSHNPETVEFEGMFDIPMNIRILLALMLYS